VRNVEDWWRRAESVAFAVVLIVLLIAYAISRLSGA